MRGITLIELLIGLVIAAVLAAIAVPTYRAHVIRTQRVDAIAALLRVQAAQEKYFVEHGRYASDLTAPAPAGLGLPATSEEGYYSVRLSVGSEGAVPASYTATATPIPGKGPVDDRRCQFFSIDQNGLRRAQDTEGRDRTDDCWG